MNGADHYREAQAWLRHAVKCWTADTGPDVVAAAAAIAQAHAILANTAAQALANTADEREAWREALA